jgi:hypothetical protein
VAFQPLVDSRPSVDFEAFASPARPPLMNPDDAAVHRQLSEAAIVSPTTAKASMMESGVLRIGAGTGCAAGFR